MTRCKQDTRRGGARSGLVLAVALATLATLGCGGGAESDPGAGADSPAAGVPAAPPATTGAGEQAGASSTIQAPATVDTSADTVSRGAALKSTETPIKAPAQRPPR